MTRRNGGFKGPVLDGPWRRQEIEADTATVSYEDKTGFYSYSRIAKGWYWIGGADGADGEHVREKEGP